jgi:hypothetical protein
LQKGRERGFFICNLISQKEWDQSSHIRQFHDLTNCRVARFDDLNSMPPSPANQLSLLVNLPTYATQRAHDIAALPERQELLPLQVRPNQRLVLDRSRASLHAALAHTRGEEQASHCGCLFENPRQRGLIWDLSKLHKIRGIGPFTKCVCLTEALNGSCTNCHYSGRGKECSLHKLKAKPEA